MAKAQKEAEELQRQLEEEEETAPATFSVIDETRELNKAKHAQNQMVFSLDFLSWNYFSRNN